MHALDIHAARVREEHEVVVCAGGEEVLDEVALLRRVRLAGGHADDALAAPALGAVGGDGGALDEAGVREGDDDALVGDEVFDGDFALVGDNLREAWRGVLFLNGLQLVLDDGHDARLLREDVHEVLDDFEEGFVFGFNLVNFQTGELVEAKLKNSVHLTFAERETAFRELAFVADEDTPALDLLTGPLVGEQLHAGLFLVVAAADDVDELVEVRERDEVAFEQFGAFLSLAQLETRAAQDDLAAMVNVGGDELLEVQRLGLAVVNGKGVDAEGNLELGVLKEVVDDDLGQGVTFQLDDEAAVLVGLVAHRGDVRDDLLVHEVGDARFERRAVHVEGDFRDDELLAVALELLAADFAAQLDGAAPGLEIILDALDAADEAAGREVGAFDESHQARNADGRVFNLRADAVNDLAEVVGRHVRGHADRDARAAVDKEVRKRRREDGRLRHALVVVRDEVHRVPVHVLHQRRTEVREPGLGVTHRGGRVGFDGTKVAFAVHELLAHHPGLGHVDKRGVNHRLAVRVVIAGGVAADFGALVMLAPREERQLVHRVEDAALRRLEAVAHVGQRARDDDGHRVVEERVLDLVRDVDLGDLLALRVGGTGLRRWCRRDFFGHVGGAVRDR